MSLPSVAGAHIRTQREMSARHRLAPQTGTALQLAAGDILRVVDPIGEQVADLIAFSRDTPSSWLSSGRTFDYNETIYLTTNHVLYSNRSVPMLTIVADTVGRHDFLYTPCSAETFSLIYKTSGHHPSCLENLAMNLAPYGVDADDIPTTFNIFMNAEVGAGGALTIRPPRSRAGDFIELRAEMDLLVGLTACSAEMSNNYKLKPIDYEVRRATDES
jgi:uncharacterized protein YcgI (DUF1989 family)